jgi:selenocysteine lyase/cysteine desulfurase
MAADKIFEARELVAGFLGVNACEKVVFTPNATFALNLVIKGLVNEKCHCIVSDLEHNSVLRPLYKSAQEHGADISFFDTNEPLEDALNKLIRPNTKVLISTLCSNVTGRFIDLHVLSRVAKKHNIALLLDASQYLGHNFIDLSDVYFTALCCAGHKGLFGIQGAAFAFINDCQLIDTLCEGGSGVDSFSEKMPLVLPERYEAGTLPTPAIVGLGAGIKFINEVGVHEIDKKLTSLSELMKYELSSVPDLKLYGAENGIASFNIAEYPSSYVSEYLDKLGIATRSGFHCAPLIHKKLKTENRGAVRASMSYFNSESDIYSLVKALKSI